MNPRRTSSLILLGLLMVGVLIGVAVGAPVLAPYSPAAQRLDEGLRSSSPDHPFGQDALGRDLLSRVIYGSRVSLFVGLSTVLVSGLLGLVIGLTSGYLGGWIDELGQRLVDVLLAFPGLLLAIAVSAVLGPSVRHVVLALCVISWTGYARLVRAEVLWLREREFVMAARALGATPWRILMRHLTPQVLPLLVVQSTFGLAGAVMAEASLSFLGLGVQPPTPSWGAMINEARGVLLIAPHLTIFPGLALILTVIGFFLLGEGLREALDVRAQN